jgi:hypothetical protein
LGIEALLKQLSLLRALLELAELCELRNELGVVGRIQWILVFELRDEQF